MIISSGGELVLFHWNIGSIRLSTLKFLVFLILHMSMETEGIHSKPKTYFTISPNSGGITDQLLEFCIYHKLGRSLGYQYLHTPFRSPRSSLSLIPLSFASHLGHDHFLNKVYRKLYQSFYNYWSRIELKFRPNAYDFLGFNAYLTEKTGLGPSMENLEKIELKVGDRTLKENDIRTLEGIQNFVSHSVSRKISGKKDILVTFRATSFPVLMGEIIHSNIRDNQDGLDLNKSYFEARQKRPWKSKFEDSKIKIVVHIRQGDIAVVETPWKTFIPVWCQELVEYHKFSDIQYDNRVFHLDEYYEFIKKFLSHFEGTKFSSLIFSDGFKRAFFQFTNESLNRLNLTKEQLKSLMKTTKSYDKKAFNRFTNLEGSTLVLGESPRSLCDLIHSILIADIIIIGPRAGMVPKLLATYGHVDKMPIVVALHKGTTPPFSHTDYLGLDAKAKNFIYINIFDDNYEIALSKLSNLMTNLHPKHQHSQSS